MFGLNNAILFQIDWSSGPNVMINYCDEVQVVFVFESGHYSAREASSKRNSSAKMGEAGEII